LPSSPVENTSSGDRAIEPHHACKPHLPIASLRTLALIVHPQSWLTVLPETNYEVLAIVAQHNIRVLRNEYNPASGLLPTINLGDGLSSFVNRGNHGSYTGVVRVLKPVPEIFSRKQLRQKLSILDESDPGYPTGMVIADLSGSTAVLVSGDARVESLSCCLQVTNRLRAFGAAKVCSVRSFTVGLQFTA
jgi:hypothetical protein